MTLRIPVEQESTFFFYSNTAISAQYIIIRLKRKREACISHLPIFSSTFANAYSNTDPSVRQWKNQCQPSKPHTTTEKGYFRSHRFRLYMNEVKGINNGRRSRRSSGGSGSPHEHEPPPRLSVSVSTP